MPAPRPRLLDLFCGAGGAAMGYHRAGFDVVGVDLNPQPRYPFEFVQADALTYPLDGFDAIHAAPLWFRSSRLTRQQGTTDRHAEQIAPMLERLRLARVPWVLEQGSLDHSPDAYLLCGPSLGLEVIRHMWFVTSFPLLVPPCSHRHGGNADGTYVSYASTGRGDSEGRYNNGRRRPPRQRFSEWMRLADLAWMTAPQARLASPPVYTELIGAQLIAYCAGPRDRADVSPTRCNAV